MPEANLLLIAIQLAGFAAALLYVQSMPEPGRSGIIPPLSVLLICGLLAVFVFSVSDPVAVFSDFRNAYYKAAASVLVAPAELQPMLEKGVFGFVNLPITVYLFVPFALLPVKVAFVVFAAIGIACVVWAWWLLLGLARLSGKQGWVLLLVFSAFGPLLYSFREGNTSHMLLLALVAALILLRRERNVAAGLVLGFAALIKLPLVLFGAYFVLRRNWMALSSFVAIGAAAVLLSLAVFGWDMNQYWFETSVLHYSREPIAGHNNQSIRAFVARLFEGPAVLYDWKTLPETAGQRLLASSLVGLVYLCAAMTIGLRHWFLRQRKDASDDTAGRDLEYLLFVMLPIVTSPISWTHYYVWVLFPIAYFLSADPAYKSTRATRWVLWAVVFLCMPIVTRFSFSSPLAEAFYAKVAVSHVLFGGILCFLLIAWKLVEVSRAPEPCPELMR